MQVAKDFALKNPDTLVIVTADHECSGAAIIGASTKPISAIQQATANPSAQTLRDPIVGVYQASKFPKYTIAADGYPQTTDVDYKMLIGYGANSDRYENYAHPSAADQRHAAARQRLRAALAAIPATTSPTAARQARARSSSPTDYFITGQVPGDQAVHTGGDIPLSAYGRGSRLFGGTLDNTDVFFRLVQATAGGVNSGGSHDDHEDD